MIVIGGKPSGNLWKRIFFYEYGLRPHVSSVFSGCIWKFLKTFLQSGNFLSDTNTYTCMCDCRIRKFANTLTSFSWIQSSRRALWTKWHQGKVVASLLHVVALVSSLVSCFQINVAVINLHNQYIRDRQDVLRLQLSMNSVHHKVKKRANRHQRQFCLDEIRKDMPMVGQFYQWHNDWRRMKRE